MSAVMPDRPIPVPPVNTGEPRDTSPALQKTEPVATSDSTPAPEISALERLEASRARLRGALLEIAHPTPPAHGHGAAADLKARLLRMARDVPGVSIIADSVESWWAQHPLHTAGIVAMEASKEVIVPLARRNPFMLLLGATAIGAVLIASRPWRWIIRPALFIGLVPQLASHLIRRVPLDSWMRMGMRFLTKSKPSSPPRPASQRAARAAAIL